MEIIGSLSYSQDPSTGPHPEPDKSSPYNPHRISLIHFNIILPPILSLPSGLLLVFQPKQTKSPSVGAERSQQ
jgi:hypothetical protein